MYKKSKYVVFYDGARHRPEAIIFSSNLIHADVARRMRGAVLLPVSAGFVDMGIVDGAPHAKAHGRSDSLNLDSQPGDSVFVMQSLGLGLLVSPEDEKVAVDRKNELFELYGD